MRSPPPRTRPARTGAVTGTSTSHTIAISRVEEVLQGARRLGLGVEAILRRAGIPLVLMDHPTARVSQAQYAALLRALRRATRDDFVGLCSRPLPPGTFAWACRELVRCGTVGEALRTGLSFYRPLLADFAPRLHVRGGLAQVRLHPRVPPQWRADFAERLFLFFAYGLASWLAARRIPLVGVDYRGSLHERASDVPQLYNAPLRHGQPAMAFTLEARWLDLPVVQNTATLAEFLKEAPANLPVRYSDHGNVTERIRRYLRRHLSDELPSLVEVSRALGLTPQTLHRRLAEEGQGFRTLKDDLRRDAAIEYLARPELGLAEVARLLGFSESSTFHRAFKKWTGVAPGEYRAGAQRHAP